MPAIFHRGAIVRLSIPVCVACVGMVWGTVAAAEQPAVGGTYDVRGIAANGSVAYSGKVTVKPTGQTYRVEWSLSGGREVYIGTGIRVEDSFAVVYTAPKADAAKRPGLVLYAVQPDGSLTGYYTTHGASTISAEAWQPQKL